MAFTGNYMCTSFKLALLEGEMDFSSDTSQTFKIALYDAGGKTLTATTSSSGATAFVDFGDVSWASSTITARGALIYKSGGTNPAIAVLDFGSNKSSSNSTFPITFPTADVSSAIIRIGQEGLKNGEYV